MFKISRSAYLLLLAASSALAQLDTGSIIGTVRDASGGAIPKTTVRLTNTATNVTVSTTTATTGQYQFSSVRVGVYTIKASAPGFSAQAINNVQIDVQSRPSIDFDLKVGDVTQTLEVTAATPLLSTQSADVGGVVQEQQIRDLPLNGRRYSDLALLEAGIQKSPTVSNAAPDRFSSNGNLETQNYFSLDGIENNSGSTNLQEGSVQVVQPPPDDEEMF